MSTTRLSCHRGANRIAPENTYAAAEGAIALGADFIEVDVRKSSDGVLYILHDDTVDRTTDGTGAIESMTSADLDALDAGSWFGSEFAGQRLPKFDEYLAWLRGKCGIYVEIKQAPVGPVVDLVKRHGFAGNSYFFSFDLPTCDALIAATKEIPTMGLLRVVGSIEAIAARGFGIVEFLHGEMTAENIRAARDNNLQIQVFHPSDDPEIFRSMIEAGVDYANVDHPESFKRVQRQMAAG